MALLGAVGAFGGINGFRIWEGAGPALRAYYLLSLFAGLAMALCAIWLFQSQKTRPAWLGAGAAAVLGVALVAGILTGTIPCSGPS
jgi:hypothetical protein